MPYNIFPINCPPSSHLIIHSPDLWTFSNQTINGCTFGAIIFFSSKNPPKPNVFFVFQDRCLILYFVSKCFLWPLLILQIVLSKLLENQIFVSTWEWNKLLLSLENKPGNWKPKKEKKKEIFCRKHSLMTWPVQCNHTI